MKNRRCFFIRLSIGFQAQALAQGNVLFRMRFIIGVQHVLLDGGEDGKLDQQVDKSGQDENRNDHTQKENDKMGDQNCHQDQRCIQSQLCDAQKQIVFEVHKGQQKAVFVDFGEGQIKGDDHEPDVIAHEGENRKAHEKKSQTDICHDPDRIVVEQDTEAQRKRDQHVDHACDQGLLPVGFDGIEEIADPEGVPLTGNVTGDIGDPGLGQTHRNEQSADHEVYKIDGYQHPEALKPKLKKAEECGFLLLVFLLHGQFLLYLILFFRVVSGWMPR